MKSTSNFFKEKKMKTETGLCFLLKF